MVVTNEKELSKKEVKSLMNEVIETFEKTFEGKASPSTSIFEKCFTNNYQLTSNGVVRCRNLADYVERFKRLQARYETVEFSGPLEEPLVSGNKFSIFQTIDLTPREGKRTKVLMMAYGTVENHKISSWMQVTHVIGNDEWD